jgi:GDP-D-mannose dehydratase
MPTTDVIVTGVRAGRGRYKAEAMLAFQEIGTKTTGVVIPLATSEERRAMLLNSRLVKHRKMKISYTRRTDTGTLIFPVFMCFLN